MTKLNMTIGLAVLSVVAQGCGALTDKQRGEFFDFLKDTQKTSETVTSVATGRAALVIEDTARADFRKRAVEILNQTRDCTATATDFGFKIPNAECPMTFETRGKADPAAARGFTSKQWALNNTVLSTVVDTTAFEWKVRTTKAQDESRTFTITGKISSKLYGPVIVDGRGHVTKEGLLDSHVEYAGLKNIGTVTIDIRGDFITGELEYWVGGKRLEYNELAKALGEGKELTQLDQVK